jgi:hypothetical protein
MTSKQRTQHRRALDVALSRARSGARPDQDGFTVDHHFPRWSARGPLIRRRWRILRLSMCERCTATVAAFEQAILMTP